MPLLNYTTTVPVSRTVGEVQKILVKAGALRVGVFYGNSQGPIGLDFTVDTAFGPRDFVLPINPRSVQDVLNRQNILQKYKTIEHAHRVAWRIMKDWTEAQLAIIQAEMVALDQVMLPYMKTDDGRSVYQVYRDQNAIEAGPSGRNT